MIFRYKLLSICDSVAIYSYGVAIALGLMVFTSLITKNRRFAQLNLELHFSHLIFVGIAGAFIGGRLLHIISYPHEIQSIWDILAPSRGGFSIVGSLIGLLIALPAYLHWHKLPILPTLDLASIYAPLLQSTARLGCLFAGCCHGVQTGVLWAVIYHDPESMAPLNIWVHPTQLYSALALFGIFLFMYTVAQHSFTQPGQLTALYLFLASSERFLVDFWRADRIFWWNLPLSLHQCICLSLMLACILFLAVTLTKRLDRDQA